MIAALLAAGCVVAFVAVVLFALWAGMHLPLPPDVPTMDGDYVQQLEALSADWDLIESGEGPSWWGDRDNALALWSAEARRVLATR